MLLKEMNIRRGSPVPNISRVDEFNYTGIHQLFGVIIFFLTKVGCKVILQYGAFRYRHGLRNCFGNVLKNIEESSLLKVKRSWHSKKGSKTEK